MIDAPIRHACEDDYPAIAGALQGWWTQPGFTEAENYDGPGMHRVVFWRDL